MASSEEMLDRVLEKLVRDIESAVHAMYRGDARQQTVKVRTDVHRKAARDALSKLFAGPARGNGAAAPGAPAASRAGGGALAPDEATAITRCIMAWLPMGAPTSAEPGSRCVPAGRELIPAWGERERARQALRRIASP
jgi:hypothetical protein